MDSRKWIGVVAIAFSGCGGFGRVNQGRVVAYDARNGLVTLISDSNERQPGQPRYEALPPVTVRVPSDAKEMGQAPEAGKLLRLDLESRRAVVFDAATRGVRTIDFTLVERAAPVFRDDPRVKGARFPVIDRARKTVTVYFPRQRELITFSVAGEHLALPADTWKAGDEVRYYYKDPAQALRLMNVTKSDLT